MTTSLVMKWLYWNFALSATDEVINYKRSSAIFWNLFCDFEGICAILSGLSDEALTITIPLIGRCSRSFSNVSTTIFLQPSKNLLWLGVGGGWGGGNVEILTTSFVAALISTRHSSSWLLWIFEKFFALHFSDCQISFSCRNNLANW